MIRLPSVSQKLFPIDQFKTIKEYFEYYVFEKNIDVLDRHLFNSSERRQWLEHYPNLECFPKTLSYIQNENSVPLSEVAKELTDVKLLLPENEILFHSGNLPNNIPLSIGTKFNLKEIFSATLDPYIAIVHDSDDDIYWHIHIKDKNIRCLPIPDV